MGLGDRLGLATPGHIRAVRGTGVKPVLAQQSIREMTRTRRTPQQVMDDALWGVFEEGFRDGFGADADHLKSTADIDATLAAGFRMFTIDPGEHVDNAAGHESVPALLGKLRGIPWAQLETTEADCRRAFLGRAHRVDYDMELAFSEETLLRAVVKYGRAVAHTVAPPPPSRAGVLRPRPAGADSNWRCPWTRPIPPPRRMSTSTSLTS